MQIKSTKDDLKHKVLKIIFRSILAGFISWIIVGSLNYYIFKDYLRFMMFKRPVHIVDTLFIDIPTHDLFIRLLFVFSFLITGIIWSVHIVKTEKYKDELRKQKEQAEKANQLKTEFLANMSHEIRTPITAIIGFTELLLKKEVDKKKKYRLSIIEKSSRALLDIINDILDIAKIEAGELNINIKAFSIKKLAGDIEKISSGILSERTDIDFKLDVKIDSEDDNIITGDLVRIKQIALNLISNAIKFTRNGKVEVIIEVKNHSLYITVKDNGSGIPEDKLDTIFDKFAQANSGDNRRYEGTGLGLAISRKLALLMNGNLSVVSRKGIGSSFLLKVPISLEHKTTDENLQAIKYDIPIKTRISGCSEKLNCLIVEDHIENLELMTTILEKEGHKVIPSTNGLDACKLFDQHDVDLVFMDIQMPDMDGFECLKLIRKKDKDIPVIAISAHTLVHQIEKALKAGFNEFITKPFHSIDLLSVVSRFSKHYDDKSN